MKNKLSKYLLSLVLFMGTSGMILAQDLIVDHKTIGKLGDEITVALGAMSADNVKSFKVISTNKAFINPDDVRGMKTILQKIQNIDLSEVNCTLFDASAFQNYNSLISISLPILNGAAISKYMFKGCINFKEIKNWGNVRKIDEEAFLGCINFNTTSFPETLEEIGKNAFKGCTGLTTSILPSNIKIIGYQAFRESNVTFSEWPSSIQQIENRAFCITPVTFTTWPEHITTITPGVFINCNKIIEFIIPTSVTEVGGSAFRLSEKVNRNIYLSSVTPPITIADTDESGKGNKNPFSTDANTMTNQESVILHIPADGKSLYKAADFWKKIPAIKTRALSSTTLSGIWTKSELESMDITDANLTDIDMTGITIPADVALSGASNPNLLVYTKASDNITVDKGFVVKDGQIENIVLTDLKPFNPSKPISVGNISYSRPATAAFETICLPFEAVVPVGCDVMELSGGTSEQVSLNKVTKMVANTPYMILKGAVETYSFSAIKQTISNEMKTVTTEAPYDYKGTYLPISVTAENGESIMYVSDGTEFRLTGKGATILPFRAFLEGDVRTDAAPIQSVKVAGTVNVDGMELQKNDIYSYSSNGTLYLNSPRSQMLNIYGIDGRLVRTEILNEGENKVVGLNKGIYIIENKKVVVK